MKMYNSGLLNEDGNNDDKYLQWYNHQAGGSRTQY